MTCLMCIQEVTSTLKDLVIAGAAATGAWVALKGLEAWRAQMVGTSGFQVARDLMRAAYQMRMALQSVRNPWILPSEFPEGYDPLKDAAGEGDQYAYAARWKSVEAASVDLNEAALEAEVLWGFEARETTNQLWRCRSKLFACVRQHVRHLNRGSGKPESEAALSVLYNESGESPDEYTLELSSAIETLEALARPHLDRK